MNMNSQFTLIKISKYSLLFDVGEIVEFGKSQLLHHYPQLELNRQPQLFSDQTTRRDR